MAENDKKYFWLKLKRDFFKRHDIQIIEDMPNGKDYILFYLKLLCESVDHEGHLRFSEEIPYNEEMLASLTHTNIDIVRSAVKLFAGLRMIDIMDDGTYYMNKVQKMIGSETYWAQKKREQREKQLEVIEIGHCPKLSNPSPNCPSKSIEKDKDKELDKDIIKEIHKEKPTPQQIVDLFNSICVSFPSVRSLSDARKKAINARLNTYTLDDFKKCFELAESSSFLKGNNPRNWIATFDWIIKDANMPKVLEGQYANKEAQVQKRYGNFDVNEAFNKAMARSQKQIEMHISTNTKTVADDEALRERAEALRLKIAQEGGTANAK